MNILSHNTQNLSTGESHADTKSTLKPNNHFYCSYIKVTLFLKGGGNGKSDLFKKLHGAEEFKDVLEYIDAPNIKIGWQGDYLMVTISGNPTIFLKKYNVWERADISVLLVDYITTILKGINLWKNMTKGEQCSVQSLNIIVSTMHIVTDIKPENDREMASIMKALKKPSESDKSKPIESDIISFGAKGYHQLTFYDKSLETKQKLSFFPRLLQSLPTINESLICCKIRLEKKWINKNDVCKLNDLLSYIRYTEGDGKFSSDSILKFFIKRFSQVNFGQTAININDILNKTKVIEGAVKHRHNFSGENDKAIYCNHDYLFCFMSWLEGNKPLERFKRTKSSNIRKGLMTLVDIDISLPCIIDNKSKNSQPLKKLIVDRMVIPPKNNRS